MINKRFQANQVENVENYTLIYTGSMKLDGLNIDWDKLFGLNKFYLDDDMAENMRFLRDQVGSDLPGKIKTELQAQKERIDAMPDED